MEKINKPLKLHLGCGQTYLDGYLNIDYPPSEHTVQQKTVADQFEDIKQLRFDLASVDEIRLHHVFEHFRRPEVAAMVACWNTWLKAGGVLHIEVPDLAGMAKVFLNPFSTDRAKAVAERHLFGSHEAAWAAHYEGYDEHLLKKMLKNFGFSVYKVRKKKWRGTHNIHVYAKKNNDLVSIDHALSCGKKYLCRFLVDDSPGELSLLDEWMKLFEMQLRVGWCNRDKL